MNANRIAAIAVASLLTAADAASANGYRIYYKGSEAAIAPAGVIAAPYPPPAVAVPPPPVAVAPAAPVVAAPVPAGAACLNCNPGSAQAKNYGAGTPNAIVTFLHPYTNKAVTIPMTLPVGKPRLVTKADRIIYDYGKFGLLGRYIVVKFEKDGTVMVNYH